MAGNLLLEILEHLPKLHGKKLMNINLACMWRRVGRACVDPESFVRGGPILRATIGPPAKHH